MAAGLLLALAGVAALHGATPPEPVLDAAALQAALAHGPWPAAPVRDGSNRVSGQPAAIAFGEALFHSTRLSRVDGLRCASCHEPWRRFTDGRPLGRGAENGDRNTPTLLNAALQRWYGWDGANETLWAQTIRPLLDAREMRSDPATIAAAVRGDERYRAMYRATFGTEPGGDDTLVMVDLAKALAAYQETLVSGRTPFDDFRDALADGDRIGRQAYPEAALRGLRLFDGAARCATCHSGPTFSDGAFHLTAIGHDGGRAEALKRLAASPYALSGRYNDGAPLRAAETGEAGAFRTPGLREVAATGPWMHDGSVANLCEAVDHHAGETGPPLTPDQRRDLVAFLRTLSSGDAPFVDPATLTCR
jgi:cytochrome c peroxidase